ncbi:MAG TPA: LysR family transcriptional regulator [Polyangiaceae bacterium]|nr:LysR family transcriptional regulator [Polyangiaceae bacterium]
MRAVDISQVDLNLLVVLDALLERGSVTGAAASLGLTQPTVSHALARLRDLLGDPILVRAGRGMVRTPRAEALGPALRRVLGDVRRVLAHDLDFDPKASARAFVVACPDLLVAFLPEVLGRFAREAPRASLEIRAPPAELGARLAEGALDLAVLPAQGEGPGLVQRLVGSVHWCVLARTCHPALRRGRLDLAAWLGSPHVVVRTGEGSGAIGRELARRGLERRVAFAAPSSLAAAHAVAHTDWFFAAPRELVRRLADDLDLAVLDPPVAMPPVRVGLVWHERMQADPGHRWLRQLFTRFAARTLAEGRPAAGRATQPTRGEPKTRRSTSPTRRPVSTGLTSTQ